MEITLLQNYKLRPEWACAFKFAKSHILFREIYINLRRERNILKFAGFFSKYFAFFLAYFHVGDPAWQSLICPLSGGLCNFGRKFSGFPA